MNTVFMLINGGWQRLMQLRKGMGLIFLALTFVMAMFSVVVKAQESGVSPPPTCGYPGMLPCPLPPPPPPPDPPVDPDILHCLIKPSAPFPIHAFEIPDDIVNAENNPYPAFKIPFGPWIPVAKIYWECSFSFSLDDPGANVNEEQTVGVFFDKNPVSDAVGELSSVFATGVPGLGYFLRASVEGCNMGGDAASWFQLGGSYSNPASKDCIVKLIRKNTWGYEYYPFDISVNLEIQMLRYDIHNTHFPKIPNSGQNLFALNISSVYLNSPSAYATYVATQTPVVYMQYTMSGPPSCTTSVHPVIVNLGSITASQIPNIGDGAGQQPFSFVLSCTPGSGTVKYRLESHPNAVALSNNVLPNIASNPAIGAGIQIRNASGSDKPAFNQDIDLPDWNSSTGGTYFVNLSARIVRTEQATSPGNLNSQMRLVVKYQ